MNWFAQFGRWLVDDISRRLEEMSGRRKAALAFSVLLLIFLLWWRGPRPGDLYSVEGEAKNYKVAKVLVVDSDAVHIRLYKNSFMERPSNVDPSTLSLARCATLTASAWTTCHSPAPASTAGVRATSPIPP